MMRKTCVRVALVLAPLLLAKLAHGDGGALILREERDSLVVTLRAAPTPLRVGPAAFDVLVQSRATGDPLLSADVRLRLLGPEAGDAAEVSARPELGGNRLFRGARMLLPHVGTWRVEVVVVGAQAADQVFRAELEVAPPQSPVRRYWAFIAATPLGVALLVLHQVLRLAKLEAAAPRALRELAIRAPEDDAG